MKAIIFEIIEDEDGFHSKYEIITERNVGGDFIKFNCKTLREAVKSLESFPFSTIFLKAIQ